LLFVDNPLPNYQVDGEDKPSIGLISQYRVDASVDMDHYFYIDDGKERVRDVLNDALASPVMTDLASLSDDVTRHIMSPGVRLMSDKSRRRIEERSEYLHLAMLVSLGQLQLMNTQYGRAAVDNALFSQDSMDQTVDVVRTLEGFLLFADTSVDRSKWQWMAEEIVTMVRDIGSNQSPKLLLSANVGLASRKQDEHVGKLIDRASTGVENARNDASSHIKWADRGSDLDIQFATTLEHDLTDAIANGQVLIRFQPQFAMNDNHLIGAEALARWQHPQMGELGASILFSVAERAGLMQPLSQHIQKEALKQAAAWPAALSNLRLSLNITAQDLAVPDFVEHFGKMVEESHFDPNCLTVEITETDLISELDRAAGLCADLRNRGLRVAIDDFGTGFSSLLYLKSLPLDYLKLDGAMSADIEGSSRDRVIVRSVIALGRALNLSLIAEGVETLEQRDSLAEEGCQFYQGFLGGKAMETKDFVAFALRAN